MKSILSLFAISILLTITFSCSNKNRGTTWKNRFTSSSEEYILQTSNSVVNWECGIIGIYNHTGTLNFKSGTIKLNEEQVTGGNFTVDMNSILATDPDENYRKSPRKKLVTHLKSDDFFSVEKYPTATFEIESYSKSSLSGILTIRGIKHEENVENIIVTKNEETYIITGDMTFDRTMFDVAYQNNVADKAISKDIQLKIKLTVKKDK